MKMGDLENDGPENNGRNCSCDYSGVFSPCLRFEQSHTWVFIRTEPFLPSWRN